MMIFVEETTLTVIIIEDHWLWGRLDRMLRSELPVNGGWILNLFDLDSYLDDVDAFWDEDEDSTLVGYDGLVATVQTLMEQSGNIPVYVVRQLIEQMEMEI